MSSFTSLFLDLDSSSSDEDIFIAALLACEEEEDDDDIMALCLHDSNRTNKEEKLHTVVANDNSKTDKTTDGNFSTEKCSTLNDIRIPSNVNNNPKKLNATNVSIRLDEQRKLCIEKKKKRKNIDDNDKNKKKIKRLWVKYSNTTRNESGEFNVVFPELLKDENKFFQYFKMSSKQFYELLHMLQPEIESINTQFRQPISGEEKLSVTIRFLVTGDSFRSISDGYKLGQSTVRNAIYQVCDLIQEKVMSFLIPIPCKQQWKVNEEVFRDKYNFPNCIGVLAGRHVLTEKAPTSGSQYFNYKKSFSTILLAVIDPFYRFMAVEVQDYGKISSESTIFTSSELGKKFLRYKMDFPEDKPLPGTIIPVPHVAIADEAFPLSRNILRPYPKSQVTRDETKKIYNQKLNSVKEIPEKCFTLLTKRFRVYDRKLNIQPENMDKIITATCSLHNFLSDEISLRQLAEEPDPPYVRSIDILAKTGGGFSGESLAVRNDFRNYFASQQQEMENVMAVQSLMDSPIPESMDSAIATKFPVDCRENDNTLQSTNSVLPNSEDTNALEFPMDSSRGQNTENDDSAQPITSSLSNSEDANAEFPVANSTSQNIENVDRLQSISSSWLNSENANAVEFPVENSTPQSIKNYGNHIQFSMSNSIQQNSAICVTSVQKEMENLIVIQSSTQQTT